MPAAPDTAVLAPRARLRRLVTRGSAGFAERLDAESLHGAALDAYAAVVERHGGQIEGSVGDALVAVFGRTEVHEDDALRAVRAASCARSAAKRAEGLGTLGVETGEAFVGPARGTYATGEVFAVAARLERAAPRARSCSATSVHDLVRHAVRVERRAGRARAWARLPRVPATATATPAGPFVNRARSSTALRAAFARARESGRAARSPWSARRGWASRDSRASSSPRSATRRPSSSAAAQPTARARLPAAGRDRRPARRASRPVGGAARRRRPPRRSCSARSGSPTARSRPEETLWAMRRLFERGARAQPLVVVVEDVHWAQPPLLDLLEYLIAFVERSSGAAASASPARSSARCDPAGWRRSPTARCWCSTRSRTTRRARLVEPPARWLAATAARIVETAEGNPLFLEQLVAVGADGDEDALPASIQAVLAARIARLEPGERALLEEASVQGRSFYVSAARGRRDSPARLVALVQQGADPPRALRAARRGRVPVRARADPRGRLPGAAQAAARRAARARGALDRRPAGRPDETVGHHLAEAYRYRAELGARRARAALGRRGGASGSRPPPTPRSLRGDPGGRRAPARARRRPARVVRRGPRRDAAGARRRAVRGRPHRRGHARRRRGDRRGAGRPAAGARRRSSAS